MLLKLILKLYYQELADVNFIDKYTPVQDEI